MGDIITYENLYEIVHKEKSNDSLQKINDILPEQIAQYLNTKIQIYKEAKQKKSPDLEKIRTQVLSARRLVKTFYELRERKIINIAVSKSRTKANLEEEENLLKFEKQMMQEIKIKLDKYRKEILLELLNARTPYSGEQLQEQAEKQEIEQKSQKKSETHMVRFLLEMPKFLGKNKEVYGPFKPGDIANLDKDIVKILISNEAAEIITSE